MRCAVPAHPRPKRALACVLFGLRPRVNVALLELTGFPQAATAMRDLKERALRTGTAPTGCGAAETAAGCSDAVGSAADRSLGSRAQCRMLNGMQKGKKQSRSARVSQTQEFKGKKIKLRQNLL